MTLHAPSRERLPFVDALARFGDREAVVDGSTRVSYADLAGLVAAEAARLAAAGEPGATAGTTPGAVGTTSGAGAAAGPPTGPPTSVRRLVLLQPRNDLAGLTAYLGALAGGHVVLLAPPGHDDAADTLASRYDPDVRVHPDPEHGGYAVRAARPGSRHDLHPDLALLLSTSGTTGSPKLCRLSADNLQANAEAVADSLGVRPDDRAVTSLPMHYCYGLSVVHSHLARGATLVLTEASVLDEAFWRTVREERVTSLAGVPYTFDLLDRVGFADLDLPHLRYVTQAGGRLAPERVAEYAALGRRRGWDLVVMYGQTEATARMAVLPPGMVDANPGAIGLPVPGGSFRLEPCAAARDLPAALGEVGELVYQGPNVMLGYAERPQDLALGRTVSELRTGDLARVGESGLFEVVGRKGSFVKVAGLRVDLGQVEDLLAARGVRACAGGADDRLDVAAVGDAARVRDLVVRATRLPAHAVRVAAVSELPRLAHGKVDRQAAMALVAAAHAPTTGDASVRSREERLVALYAELLSRPDADLDSSFVSLGGDSLSYVEVSVRLEDDLGALPTDWHTTALRDLATAGGRDCEQPDEAAVGRRRHLVAADTTAVLRGAAIVAVVGTHAGLFSLRGGAHLMLGIAGYNFARFGLGALGAREHLSRHVRAVARIVVPTVLWVGAVALLTGKYDVGTVLMVNTLVGPDEWGYAWHFWFIEALVWLLVGVAALTSVPLVRRWHRERPFALAGALLAVGLLPRFDVIEVWTGPERGTPQYVFWVFAVGWAAAVATTVRQRLLVTLVVLAAVPGFFDDYGRDAVLAVGLLVLLWLPTVRVPRLLGRVLGVLASASLYIYLTQWQVYPAFDNPVLSLVASLLVGVLAWQTVERGRPLLQALRRPLALPSLVRGPHPALSTRRGTSVVPANLPKETR